MLALVRLDMPLTVIPVNVPSEVTFGCAAVVRFPVSKPVKRVADMLPAELLPATDRFPLTLAPVPVTTTTFALPADEMRTFPLFSTDTLLVPLTI